MIPTIAASRLRTCSVSCSGAAPCFPEELSCPASPRYSLNGELGIGTTYLGMATNRGGNMRLSLQAELDNPQPGHVSIPKSLEPTQASCWHCGFLLTWSSYRNLETYELNLDCLEQKDCFRPVCCRRPHDL